jgi:hypothetical protein
MRTLRLFFAFYKALKSVIFFKLGIVIFVVNILTMIPINPSLTLGFKFQILPTTERYSICGVVKCLHDLTMHRDPQHVKI